MRTLAIRDYQAQTRTEIDGETTSTGMIPANVLYYELEGGRFILRPSGTEPKLKSYISYVGKNRAEAAQGIDRLEREVNALLDRLTT